jgi:hypothetical protein
MALSSNRALARVVRILGAIRRGWRIGRYQRKGGTRKMAFSSYWALSSVVGESRAIRRKKTLIICNITSKKAPNVRILLELVA